MEMRGCVLWVCLQASWTALYLEQPSHEQGALQDAVICPLQILPATTTSSEPRQCNPQRQQPQWRFALHLDSPTLPNSVCSERPCSGQLQQMIDPESDHPSHACQHLVL